jgi:hypothetical protein
MPKPTTSTLWHGFNWEPDLPEAVTVRGAVRVFVVGQLRASP